MKNCEKCIHAEVCRMRLFPGIYDGDCAHYKTEADSLRILRFIYADCMARSNILRKKAESRRLRGQPEDVLRLRNESEAHASDAARVKNYCRKIGFDPSVGLEENK